MATKRKDQAPIILEKPRTITFSVQNAIDYGEQEAIVLEHFIYWIEANLARGTNFHDGRTWTYNTHEELTSELKYPFWSPKQIFRIIGSLEKQGVLLKGNYNQRKGDQTLWYAFQDEAKWLNLKNAPQRTEKSKIPKQERPPNKRSQKTAPLNSQTGMADSQTGMADSQTGMADSQTGMADSHLGDALPISTNNSSLNTILKNNNSEFDFSKNAPALTPLSLSLFSEEEKKKAFAGLNTLSDDQRAIAIEAFNNNAVNNSFTKAPIACLLGLVKIGLKGGLKPTKQNTFTVSKPTPTVKPAQNQSPVENTADLVRKAVENARGNELSLMREFLNKNGCILVGINRKMVTKNELEKLGLIGLFIEEVKQEVSFNDVSIAFNQEELINDSKVASQSEFNVIRNDTAQNEDLVSALKQLYQSDIARNLKKAVNEKKFKESEIYHQLLDNERMNIECQFRVSAQRIEEVLDVYFRDWYDAL